MAKPSIEEVAAKIRDGLKGLPPGPWEVDAVRQDDAPDKHNEYELLDARGYRLCDTQNCDHRFGEIQIESGDYGSSAWNEPARKLMEHVARCDPATIGALLDELEARRAIPTSRAVQDVVAERRRQVDGEGWTPEHDDTHAHGEMALAAACYAISGAVPVDERSKSDTLLAAIQFVWPRLWAWSWWKPKDQRRDLVRSAALLIAEIELIDRAALSATERGR